MSAWLYLALAAICEVIFATSMKYADGFTRPLPTVITVVAVIGGISCLTLAMKSLPLSVAYPIWTAVGTLGTVILGLLLFGEPITWAKALSVVAIIGGVAGLKVSVA